MSSLIGREGVYLWYYITLQLRQILPYWVLGMLLGSAVSVFLKGRIFESMKLSAGKKEGISGLAAASILGIASPLCMYGTIPVIASFAKAKVPQEWLAAFMMSSILLNPQLLIYSVALGLRALWVRLISSFLCGVLAGGLIRLFYKDKEFFSLKGFTEPENMDTDQNIFFRFIKNVGRNVKATGGYFFMGILLAALFQRYVPSEFLTALFGGNEALGVLMAATVGVPLYACGGGTIPLLQVWMTDGMSMGSAAAFMITGPSTKITNLGALKIVLGLRNFLLYLGYVIVFSLLTGVMVNQLV